MKAPAFWRKRTLASDLLLPLSYPYRWAGILRERRADVYRPEIPVICVGNVVAGGAGKTPLVRAIAAAWSARGQRIAVASRGYGGSAKGPLAVGPQHGAAEVGDEPAMLSGAHSVWIGADRPALIRAIEASGFGGVVMDDGLQNPTVAKTLGILVIDGESGLGNARVIPAGPLREPYARALAKAAAVVLIGEDRHGVTQRIDKPVFHAALQPVDPPFEPGARLAAFAGIGRPEKFFATLRNLGGDLVREQAFADHHPYRERELRHLLAAAEAEDAALITTEKDAARLPPAWRAKIPVLKVRLVFAEETFFPWLWKALKR